MRMTATATTAKPQDRGDDIDDLFMAVGAARDAYAELPHGLCYGLYDYSSYAGDAPPHVVRDPDGNAVFRSDSPEEARAEYERLTRLHAGRFIVAAAEQAGWKIPDRPGAASSVLETVSVRAFRSAMHMLLATSAAQYLLANTRSRSNGALKAAMHEELTLAYVAAWHGITPDRVRRRHEVAYRAVHDATARGLTDILDRAIGFDLDGYVSDALITRFIDVFHDIATASLADLQHDATNDDGLLSRQADEPRHEDNTDSCRP